MGFYEIILSVLTALNIVFVLIYLFINLVFGKMLNSLRFYKGLLNGSKIEIDKKNILKTNRLIHYKYFKQKIVENRRIKHPYYQLLNENSCKLDMRLIANKFVKGGNLELYQDILLGLSETVQEPEEKYHIKKCFLRFFGINNDVKEQLNYNKDDKEFFGVLFFAFKWKIELLLFFILTIKQKNLIRKYLKIFKSYKISSEQIFKEFENADDERLDQLVDEFSKKFCIKVEKALING